MKVMLVISLFSITACSRFSRKECMEMDWRKQGQATALKGEDQQSSFAYFGKQCRDIPVSAQEFAKGYSEGLKTFCSPEFISQFAEKGGEYRGGCATSEASPIFMERYRTSRVAFLERRVKQLEDEVLQAKSRASSAESEAMSLTGQLSACQLANH